MASNAARKKAAQLYQKEHPGTPYPEALRIVSRANDVPLTAVVSSDKRGRFRRYSFEEAQVGGGGPHCGIVGRTGSGKSNLLAVMAGSMLQSPPTRGVEIVWVSPDVPQFVGVTRAVAPAELESYLAERLASRAAQLRARGADSNRGEGADPALVVMIDDPEWAQPSRRHSVPEAVKVALRTGRSLDVHLVVTWQPGGERSQPWVLPELDGCLSNLIHLQGLPGQGTWEQRNPTPSKIAAITVPPANLFQIAG